MVAVRGHGLIYFNDLQWPNIGLTLCSTGCEKQVINEDSTEARLHSPSPEWNYNFEAVHRLLIVLYFLLGFFIHLAAFGLSKIVAKGVSNPWNCCASWPVQNLAGGAAS